MQHRFFRLESWLSTGGNVWIMIIRRSRLWTCLQSGGGSRRIPKVKKNQKLIRVRWGIQSHFTAKSNYSKNIIPRILLFSEWIVIVTRFQKKNQKFINRFFCLESWWWVYTCRNIWLEKCTHHSSLYIHLMILFLS